MKNFTLLVLCTFLLTAGRLIAQPTTSATAPTRAAADVISIFSGAYTDLAGTNFNPNWGQGTQVTDFTIPSTSDATKKYMNLDYQGTEFTSQNVASYSALHLDVWTAVVTSFKIFPINQGSGEQGIVKTTVAGWNSFDIPIADFVALGLPMTNVFQFKIQDDPYLGQGTGTKTLYFDNIYFWKAANVPTLTGFTVPAKLVGDAPFTLTAPTSPSSGAFTYTSSNTSVATISGSTVTIVGAGTSTITANQAAAGAFAAGTTSASLVVSSLGPQTAAPTPTRLAANVTSLFSNAYTNVGVDTWSAIWDVADVEDVLIAGNATKKYTNHTYSGTEFVGLNVIDATSKTHFHLDVWTADAAGTDGFKVKLVDFGANGVFDGGDDAASIELPFTPTASGWFAVDVPLSSFTGLTTKAHLAQMVLVTPGGGKTFWIDNVYLYNIPVVGPTAPLTAAPDPTKLPANVISLFSGVYTDVAGTLWFPNWGQSTVVTDEVIAGNNVKKYATLNYQGIQFQDPIVPINASSMTHLHLDIWTPNCTAFEVFLINAPGGERPFTINPTLAGWNSIDIPLSSYTAAGGYVVNLSNIGQIKLVGTPSGSSTVYLDNLYFWKPPVALPTAPLTAAPDPTKLPANVISLFSGVYTDVAGTLWFPNWGQTTVVTDEVIAGNNVKKYATLNYQGIQFQDPIVPINASSMTMLHLDIWTPNCTAFDVFLINAPGGERPYTINPTLAGWNSIDIPLSSYTAAGGYVVNLSNIGQIKLVGTPSGSSTVYLDNLYFWKPPVAVPTAPLTAAPDPTKLPANVISLFSGVYTDVAGTLWFPNWGQTTVVTDEVIAGNNVKKYATLNYQGIQFQDPIVPINASSMTHLHLDIWTPNCTAFEVFLINAPGGERAFTVNPTLAGWNSFDIPLSNYTAAGGYVVALNNIGQIKLVGTPSGSSTVYLDNLYFWRPPVIPVEMTFLKGKAVNNTTVLTWQTASERDNKGFTIERSNNATNYTTIGEVKGNGTTSAVHDYSFTDVSPLTGVNYYRLRQTDVNGKETMSKVVTVLSAKGGLFIKNTLVHDVMDITVGDAEKGPLSIFNVAGQLVYTTTVVGNQQINLSALTAGMYIVRTSSGAVSRFVKD